MSGIHVEFVLLAEITGGAFIFLGVIIIAGIGLIYGMYTRKGSGINEHPGPGSDDLGPDHGEGETELTGPDGKRLGREEADDSKLDQRGTR